MQFKRIYIEITNICNLSCSFCPTTNRTQQFMSVQDFDKIATQAALYTKYIYLHIKGEPLLHPQLQEILNICHKLNLSVNLTTNGTLIAPRQQLLLSSPALRQINISLHGYTPKTHGVFADWLSDIITFAKAASIANKYTVFRFWTASEITDNAIQILQQTFGATLTLNNRTKLNDNIFASFDSEFAWPNINAEIIGVRGTCYGTRSMLGILVDGSVVPCCLDNNGDCIFGNVLQQNLDDILQSTKIKEISQGFKDGKITHNLCMRCGYRLRFNK